MLSSACGCRVKRDASINDSVVSPSNCSNLLLNFCAAPSIPLSVNCLALDPG
jgi:hypothetical protein